MEYRIAYTPRAAREIKKLSSHLQVTILEAIEQLASDPRPPGVVKLSGPQALYRIRLGDYRIVYEIQDRELLILIAYIGDRKEIYRRLS